MRLATMEDAAMLHEWRNDDLTCEQSINSEPVPWDDHVAWLKNSLSNVHRVLMVAELDGEPVGTVRIDHGKESELSWTVAPAHRGKGLGAAMVAKGGGHYPFIAHIKRGNIASRKIAEKVGFRLESDGPLQKWIRERCAAS